MLILVSFVLAWGEAWFLDFRVLSQEMKAKECLLCESFTSIHMSSTMSTYTYSYTSPDWLFIIFSASTMYQDQERNPIVRNFINNLPSSRDNPESVANFYSPLDSPEGKQVHDSVFQYDQINPLNALIIPDSDDDACGNNERGSANSRNQAGFLRVSL